MNNKSNLFKLTGKVQHYQWGGYSFIPSLLEIAGTDSKPFAEYWLGAHDNVPSEMPEHTVKFLNQYISENPDVLGEAVRQRFGRLPYLLKVLDVKDMLSIQVHPSKKAAALEYEKENRAGIPLSAPHRNYKDDNHKPELMLALSEFWLLHGFKPEEEIRKTISAVEEFGFMLPLFEEGGYEKLYSTLMKLDQQKVNDVLQPLLDRIIPLYQRNELQRNDAAFWAARAALSFNKQGKTDRGIFSVYLLNLVHLKKDEAIFQDAGILHAYLEGQNMEIMANSDNVLRGGLTPKHIDVDELIRHVNFAAVHPQVIRGEKISDVEEVYRTPARDFQLSRILINKERTARISSVTAEIFFVFEGRVEMRQDESILTLGKGEAAVAFAGATFSLHSNESSVIFKASVPI